MSQKGDIDTDQVIGREATSLAFMMENPADYYYGVLWNKLYGTRPCEGARESGIDEKDFCILISSMCAIKRRSIHTPTRLLGSRPTGFVYRMRFRPIPKG